MYMFVRTLADANYEEIPLTEDDEGIYSVPTGEEDEEIYSVPPEEEGEEPPPTDEEYQLITIKQQPSLDINDCIELTPIATPEVTMDHGYTNVQAAHIDDDYDDPNTLISRTDIQPTKPGDYDDPDALLNASLSK